MSGLVPPNKYDVHRNSKSYKDEGKRGLHRLLPKWCDQQIQGAYADDYGNNQPDLLNKKKMIILPKQKDMLDM